MNQILPLNIQDLQNGAATYRETGVLKGALCIAATTAVTSVIITACSYLGNTVLQSTGHDGLDMPPYKDLLVPTLVGSTIVSGGLGLVAGVLGKCLN